MLYKTALIFGSNGQDGFYLKKSLESRNIKVITISRSNSDYTFDITDTDKVDKIICDYKPDLIFNLAAKSTASHEALFYNHDVIGKGCINILESVYKNKINSKVFITGSGLQFKNESQPINESTEFEALNPYSAARIYSVYLSRYYRYLGLKTYIGYLFNHESPLRKEDYISQKIVKSIKLIKDGKLDKIEVGNINVQKEWTYAGDVVEAILTLINQDNIFEAVIGSGITYSIKEWIEICFSLENLDWKKYIIQKEHFNENFQKLVSDPSLIKSLKWEPKINIKQLAQLMLNELSIK